MRLISSTVLFGAVLWLGAPAIVGAQSTSDAADDSYGSPSLLPLPDMTPPPSAYGSRGATGMSSASYQAPPAPNEPVPAPAAEPTPINPSEQPLTGTPGYSVPSQPPAPAPGYSNSPSYTATPNYTTTYPYGLTGGGNAGCATGGGNSGGLLGNSPFANCFKGWGGNSGCDNNACGGTACGGGCAGPWFASVGGLALTRNDANRFWTSYDTTNNADQVMNTQFAKAGWGGGGEVTLGRWFGGAGGGVGGLPFGGAGGGIAGGGAGGGCGCGASGIAATYWGVSPLVGSASVTSATNNLGTPINEQTQTGTVMMNSSINGGSTPSTYFFDGAHEQTVSRTDRINNVEVNYLNSTYLGNGNTQAIWLAGIRYFRFDETLTFSSVAGGHNFGDGGGAFQASLTNRSINNLVGPQIGVILNHYFTPRLGLYITPKFGIYGNAATSRTTLYTGDGYSTYDLQGSKNSFSTLAQLDIGGNYMLTQRWSIYGGYRLVAITDLALSDNQFLPYLADTVGFQQVKSNGDLLLNGAFGGLLFRF